MSLLKNQSLQAAGTVILSFSGMAFLLFWTLIAVFCFLGVSFSLAFSSFLAFGLSMAIAVVATINVILSIKMVNNPDWPILIWLFVSSIIFLGYFWWRF